MDTLGTGTVSRRKGRWNRVLALAAAGAIAGCDEKEAPSSNTSGSESPAQLESTVLPSIPGIDLTPFDGRSAAIMAKADPHSDREAWEIEARSAEASAQLKALAKLVGGWRPDAAPSEKLAAIVADDFAGAGLRGVDELVKAGAGGSFTVHRAANESVAEAAGLAARPFVEALRAPHAGDGELRVTLKVFKVWDEASVHSGDGFRTAALFEAASDRLQQNGQWTCEWSDDSPPRLRSVRVSDYERVRASLRYADATAAVAGGDRSFHEQMTVGAGYWAERLQKFYFIDSTAHQGIALGDVNGDGLEDIYVAQQGGLPNKLYLRRPNGTLRDFSAEAGVDWMELTHGVLLVDLDNDGDQDLALALSQEVLLMRNDGAGRFETGFRFPGQASYFSLAAADYDHDGDLDLYACGYSPRQPGEHAEGPRVTVPLPYHDSRHGGPNVLLRNDGGWQFSDATAEVGLGQNNDRHSFAAAWEDFDNDGDLDLYVANDFGRNNLYRNDGGRFADVAAEAGVEDMSAGMGATWGDYDRDGWMDLHVSNMFSAAGNRVTYQRQFRPGGDTQALAGFRRHARGNSLFRNTGSGTFEDVSEAAGVTMGRWAWGAKFADLDNDGWEDLYVANGYITADPQDDL